MLFDGKDSAAGVAKVQATNKIEEEMGSKERREV